jgi:peptide/nickel transport system substrate-binding protein
MHVPRFGAPTIVAMLLVLSSINCGPGRDTTKSDSPNLIIHIPNGDEYVLGPNFVDPWFLVLLGLSADPDNIQEHEPRLLDRWEHTPDYKEWTLHVREGLSWGDGAPVTAEDVKFSLELWTHPNIGYEYRYYETITIQDSHTLVVTFKEPVSETIFIYSWLAMLPKHSLDSLDPNDLFDWQFWIEPVGNGPYRYVRHIPGVMTELSANPDYYGESPRIPGVVLRFGGKSITELLSGNADIAYDVLPLEAVQVANDPRFVLYHNIRYSRHVAIVWNHRVELFQNPEVRRALTMSIDRKNLHRVLNYPDDTPIFDVPALKRHFVEGKVPEPMPFDPSGAAELFSGAGWIDTDGDGILEKEGLPFQFTLEVSMGTMTQAVYIQEQLRRVGIDMEISSQDRGVLTSKVRDRDFDATIFTYFNIENFGDVFVSGYDNMEARALRDSAWFTVDQEKVDRNLEGLWQLFVRDAPVTYLHPVVFYLLANKRVKGLRNGTKLFPTVEKLWLEEED